MNLIRVGQTVINLDSVARAEYDENGRDLNQVIAFPPQTMPRLDLYTSDNERMSLYSSIATAVWTYLCDLAVTVQS